MRIYVCSDLHVSPTHFSDRARTFLEEAAAEADLTLLCGDIYEGTWCELEDSFNSQNGQQLAGLVEALPDVVVIAGNHDWSLGEFFVDLRHPVVRSHAFNADGKRYYATHGWMEYDVALSLIAPIYGWIYRLLPKLARFLPRRKTPGELKKEASQSRSLDAVYWRFVRAMSNEAIFQAIDKGWIPIWGHSHRRHIDAYERWLTINCGDFVQDEHGDDVGGIIIEDGVPREW